MLDAIPFYLTQDEYMTVLNALVLLKGSAERASSAEDLITDLMVQCNDNAHLAVQK